MHIPKRVALILFTSLTLALAALPAAHHTFAAEASSTAASTTPDSLPLSIGGSITLLAQNIAPPTELIIPSLNLDTIVQPVGVNTKGEMAVPSGKTTNVGWYEYGTIPGNMGSAVFDAHVFAAFSTLNKLKPGDEVVVATAAGQHLRFLVTNAAIYRLDSLSPAMLFGSSDGKHLNLITCAGKLTPDHSTYDERLVVYTTFEGFAS